MSLEMWEGLGQILDEFREDRGVRVVILTGAGNKAFVSGADISQVEKNRADAEAQRAYDRTTSPIRAKLGDFPKPVIAQFRGFCLGGGLGLAMLADLRIAGFDSQFGILAARLGIGYGFDMVRRLVSLVGQANARMILFTGTRIDAREAERIGLINRAVSDEDLSDTVVDLARTIADNAPLSIAASKLSVEQTMRDPADRDLASIQRSLATCFDSADYHEGRTAFMEKHPPRFEGR